MFTKPGEPEFLIAHAAFRASIHVLLVLGVIGVGEKGEWRVGDELTFHVLEADA